MNSNNNSSSFIEHSFRRLSLLIHQQDVLNSTASISTNKATEQSINTSLLVNNKKNNLNNNDILSLSSKVQPQQQSIGDKSNNSIETMVKVKPIPRTNRIFMRPPKSRTIISYRSSPSQCFDRSENSFNYSLNSSCSPSLTQEKSNILPIHMPCERSLYDIKFERDQQNDIREKYNIPQPFQRKWLRQPRYIPQERPNFGQIQQSQN
ncbi:unnamed protein product [Rotaria sp. Silwood2]|nr:unnamed protein product [Rotaria sp. Silwood2]CAF2695375.1 unnamed protein product [Rotaria sp. Silwood2]CAF3089474.1 unnamed protein product [Rotaria sp. Silwood2]CAF4030321.1 unnamed protein product [Rotaria sp. Silwood2]CAF4163275.1 unnamed protein product [Rotaria sp. Silwood2]